MITFKNQAINFCLQDGMPVIKIKSILIKFCKKFLLIIFSKKLNIRFVQRASPLQRGDQSELAEHGSIQNSHGKN